MACSLTVKQEADESKRSSSQMQSTYLGIVQGNQGRKGVVKEASPEQDGRPAEIVPDSHGSTLPR